MTLTLWLIDVMNKKQGRIINLSSRSHGDSNYTIPELKRLESNLDFKDEGKDYNLKKTYTNYSNKHVYIPEL